MQPTSVRRAKSYLPRSSRQKDSSANQNVQFQRPLKNYDAILVTLPYLPYRMKGRHNGLAESGETLFDIGGAQKLVLE